MKNYQKSNYQWNNYHINNEPFYNYHKNIIEENMNIYEEIIEAIRKKLLIYVNGEFCAIHNPEDIFWIFGEAVYMKDYMPDACGRIIGLGYDKIVV